MNRLATLTALAALATLTAGTASAASANEFANGGFEITPGVSSPAQGWQAAAEGYTITSVAADVNSGSNAAVLTVGFPAAAVLLQNSVADGGQPPLTPGDTFDFSFFAKGQVSNTGNILYNLKFLAGSGAIIDQTGNTFFQGDINPNNYVEIIGGNLLGSGDKVVPVGAVGAFLEISQASGPLLDGPVGQVFIDDVVLATVPEPSSLALLGLSGLALMRRRRNA